MKKNTMNFLSNQKLGTEIIDKWKYLKILGSSLQFKVTELLQPNGTLVLLYHSVYTRKHDQHFLSVTPANFEAQLRLLRSLFQPISADIFYHSISHKICLPKTVLLTFDDGYFDNYSKALPIMEKYRIPGLFFVPTLFLGKKSYPWDKLPPNQEVLKTILSKPPKKAAKDHVGETRPLSKRELVEFAKSPLVTIGGHTHSHPQLSTLSAFQQQKQVALNFRTLSAILGKPPKYFAYPFGYLDDYNRDTLKIVKKFYEMAFTTVPGKANSFSDRFQLPRVNIRNQSAKQFNQLLKSYCYNEPVL